MLNVTMTMWAKVAYVGVSVVTLIIAAVIAYRIVRGFVRSVGGSGSVFGTDARSRVIGFGLANLLFPRVLPELVRLTVALFVGIFGDIPASLMTQYQRAVPYCRVDAPAEFLDQCVGQLGLGLANAWGRGLDYWYGDKVRSFPFADFMLMLAAWAIFAQAFAPVPSNDDGETNRAPWLQDAYARLSVAGRQNLRFFVVLATAGYLSIAAIAAIPSLREPTTGASGPTSDALKQTVAEGVKPVDVTTIEKDNPFLPLEGALRSTPEATEKLVAVAIGVPENDPLPTRPRVDAQVKDAITESLALRKQQRQELISQLKVLASNSDLDLQKARALAITTYDANNVGRRGTREQTQHYLEIISWYRDAVGAFESRISDCKAAIASMDRGWNQWAEFRKGYVESGGKGVPPTLALESEFQQYSNARDACQQPLRTTGDVPSRPALGAYLGPFGFVASWLVRTESLPLALVVGLLGFGLLGSACSTFVREQKSSTDDGVLVKDLPGVVIRGLSAAVVVFLAVEGGLAIFAGGTTDPNPYVLLLTCLIGAVFSEQVWEWAQRKLRDELASHPKAKTPSTTSGKTAASSEP